jgi:hypothetical protein
MTLQDLYSYFEKQNANFNFNSDNDSIVVQLQGIMKFSQDTTDDNSTSGLLPVTLWSCHTGINDNKTEIVKEDMDNALNSFINKPILGFIHKVNGVLQFKSHEFHEDEDGNRVYDEKPIGIVPESCNIRYEHDDESDKDYVVVDGFI